MATRSRVGIRNDDDSVDSIYVHHAGYPQGVGSKLVQHYLDEARVRELMALGDLSALAPEIGVQHRFDNPYGYGSYLYDEWQAKYRNMCLAYGRDLGESNTKAKHSATVQDFRNIDCGAEYYYIWHYGRWLMQERWGKNANTWQRVDELLVLVTPMDTKPVIVPVPECGSHRTGGLKDITVAKINKLLGFKPNVEDDPHKVKYSWGFTVDGEQCGVWDYKRSYRDKEFSTWGPADALRRVFGENYVHER